MCSKFFNNPVKSMLEDKKKKNIGRVLSVTVLVSILFALAFSLVMANSATTTVVQVFVMSFLLSLVGIIFLGLVLGIIASTLGGKGFGFEGMTALAYSSVFPSIGLLITSICVFINPLVQIPVSIVVLMLTFAQGISLLYRSVKELFKVDMITAFVIISVFILVMFTTLWMTVTYSYIPLRSMWLRI